MTLHSLARLEAERLVSAASPGIDESTIAGIVEQAGGNPLYLELLAGTRPSTGAAIPESLQTAIVARVDDLDEASRSVLREASVFGQSFFEEPLQLMSEAGAGLFDALGHLCEVGLLDLQPGAHRSYSFRHSLVQQVLHDGLLRGRRADLHLRAAEALELVRDDGIDIEPEQLAYHMERAGDGQRAAAYHLASAERADRMRAATQANYHRRAANRLLSLTSLAELYGGRQRPSRWARAVSVTMQVALALALVTPVFFAFSSQSPPSDAITLGLPLDIVEANASSLLIAVAIGGLPLLLAGVIFNHLAAPMLMRRRVSVRSLALAAALGWGIALGFVVAGFSAMIVLLRLGALDRLSSIYIGASTLQILLGEYGIVWTALAGTGVLALTWVAMLRFQTSGWARMRSSAVSPKQVDLGRRLAAVGQLGFLVALTCVAAVAGLVAYRAGLMTQGSGVMLSGGDSGALFVIFGAAGVAGTVLFVWSRRALKRGAPDYKRDLLGFEIPLVSALAFGLIIWFGMREAVVVAANDVDTPGSLSTFDRAVDLFPDLSLAYYLRGERHLAATTFDGDEEDPDAQAAVDDFTKAIELDPDFPASYLARGRVFTGLRDYDAAIADADKLIELRPNHPGGYAVRALANAGRGDLGRAADDLALAIRPLDEDARGWDSYFIRCLALAAAGRLDEAKSDCEHVLELNPNHYVSLDQLVLIAGEQEQYEEGIAYLNRMIGVNDRDYRVWSNRGLFRQYLGDYEGSETDLSRAIEVNPQDTYSYVQRSITRLYLDRIDDALADAQTATQLSEDERYTHLYVARHTDDTAVIIDDATRILAVAEETAPTLPYLYSVRGLARVQAGDVQAGFADLDEALRINPAQPAALDRRGYARLLTGDHDGAQADLDQALQGLSSLPEESRAELYYHRALLFEATNRLDLARSEVAESLRNAEFPIVRRQVEALSSRLGSP